jgi:hypothetical protein
MPSGKRNKANRRRQRVLPSRVEPQRQSQPVWAQPLTRPIEEIIELACTLESDWYENQWDTSPLILAISANGESQCIMFKDHGSFAKYRENPFVPKGTVGILLMAEMTSPKSPMPSLSNVEKFPLNKDARFVTWLDVNGRCFHIKRYRNSERYFAMAGEPGPGGALASRALNAYPVIDETRLALDFVKVIVDLSVLDPNNRDLVQTLVAPLLDDPAPITALRDGLLKLIGIADEEDAEYWKLISEFRKNLPTYSVEELEIELKALTNEQDTLADKFRRTFGLVA